MGGKAADLIIASVDSDPGTRTAAVRELLEGNGDDKVPYRGTACRRIIQPYLQQEIGAALISRTIDTSSTVLQVLYSKPSILLPHLENGYLEAIAAVLSSPATPRQLIRLHVTFLSHHFVKTYPTTVKVVVERCLWPFLLFTKAKQKTSAAVWDILDSGDCGDDITGFQLLRGCLVVIRDLEENFVATQDQGDSDPGLQKLAAIDVALANRIAGTSITLRTCFVFLSYFLRQIISCYPRIPPITLISYLVSLKTRTTTQGHWVTLLHAL